MPISDPNVLFHAYVELANKSTEVVWVRNAAMLIANSFLVAALGFPNLQPIHAILTWAGMIVCVLWGIMTFVGWEYYYDMHQLVSLATGLVFVETRYFGDVVFICNMLLILVFFVIYFFAWRRLYRPAPTTSIQRRAPDGPSVQARQGNVSSRSGR